MCYKEILDPCFFYERMREGNDMLTEKIDRIIKYILDNHQCHTIILYGSHARGESTPTSDYDIIAIRNNGEFERDCSLFENSYLDIFIYPDNAIEDIDRSFIQAKDGIVLCQKDHVGDQLLDKIKSLFQQGPPKTPDWEKQEIVAWLQKMFVRANDGDIEGNFRRHWLLHDILECYFKLRDDWYFGPKESFARLKDQDQKTYLGFDNALKPNASLNEIENLIKVVINGAV